MKRRLYRLIVTIAAFVLMVTWVYSQEIVDVKPSVVWKIYQKANSGLSDNNAIKILIDDAGEKWIATEKGGLSNLQDSMWSSYQTTNSEIPHNSIYALAIDAEGNKWVGTYGSGLAKLKRSSSEGKEDEWTNFNSDNSLLPHNWILSTAVDKEGAIWVGAVGECKVKSNIVNHTKCQSGNC